MLRDNLDCCDFHISLCFFFDIIQWTLRTVTFAKDYNKCITYTCRVHMHSSHFILSKHHDQRQNDVRRMFSQPHSRQKYWTWLVLRATALEQILLSYTSITKHFFEFTVDFMIVTAKTWISECCSVCAQALSILVTHFKQFCLQWRDQLQSLESFNKMLS